MDKRRGRLSYAAKFAVLLSLLGMVQGLRNVRLSVPPAIKRGSTTQIVCHYDLEGDSLYSVKWYKGRREFFRYTPKEDPSIKVFPIHGLHVDQKKSNASHVFLRHVMPAISGRYSCEVSADAPSFHTALVSGDMDVVDLPKARPSISGVKPRYRVGETLSGNCSSPPSRPPANLTWVINGQVANPLYVTHFPHSSVEADERELEENRRMAARVGLKFVVAPHHFVGGSIGGGGKLKVRCTGSIHGLYWQSIEKSIEEERPKLSVGSPQAVEVGEEGMRPYYGMGRGHFDGVVVEDESMEVERRGGEDIVVVEDGGRRRGFDGLDDEDREPGYHGGGRRRHDYHDSNSGSSATSVVFTFLTLIGLVVSIR